MNHGSPSCAWKPNRHAVHSVAPQVVARMISATTRIWPQRIFVADITRSPRPITSSQADPPLAAEAPVDPAVAACDAGDRSAEMLFERRRPRHELETEAVVEHREPAGSQIEAAAIGARDVFADGGFNGGLARLGLEALPQRVQLAAPQRLDQVTAEADAAALTLGEPLADEMLGAALERVANLGAETAAAERDRLARDGLAVEPGGAVRRDLLLERKVRPDGERDTPPALRIVEPAQLDDRARGGVCGGVEIGEPDVMGAAIDAVDDGVGGALQLVVEPAGQQAADDRLVQALAGQHVARRPAFEAALREATMNPLDDVAPLAELAQAFLGLIGDDPLTRPDLLGEAETLQLAKAANLQRVELVGLAAGMRREIDDARPMGVVRELAVDVGPALGFDLALQRGADVAIGARAQLLGDQVARPVAHAFVDIVACDDEVLAVVTNAAHDQVDMRVLGVPVVDRHPVEPRREILLHLADQVAGEPLEVRHIDRVIRRHDEAEMVAIVGAALREGLGIGLVGAGTEEPRLLSVPGDALAPQIAEMGREGGAARAVADDACLDDGAARA